MERDIILNNFTYDDTILSICEQANNRDNQSTNV